MVDIPPEYHSEANWLNVPAPTVSMNSRHTSCLTRINDIHLIEGDSMKPRINDIGAVHREASQSSRFSYASS